MAIGLRFAGSANNTAFETIHYFCKIFISLFGKSISELAGKSTIENCLNVTLISLSMVSNFWKCTCRGLVKRVMNFVWILDHGWDR